MNIPPPPRVRLSAPEPPPPRPKARTIELPVKVTLDNALLTIRAEHGKLTPAVVLEVARAEDHPLLVIGYRQRIDMATADTIRNHFAATLPGVEIVIVDDITSMVVYRPARD